MAGKRNQKLRTDEVARPPAGPPQNLTALGAALSAGILLWVMLVFAYTWPQWPVVLYRLIVDGGVLILWLAAAAGLGWVVLPMFGKVATPSDGRLLRSVTAAAMGLGSISLVTLLLGLAGGLNRLTSMALLGAGLAALALKLVRFRGSLRSWRGGMELGRGQARWNWLGLLAVPFAAVMTAGAMLPPYFLWSPEEPHGYDVVEYHLQVPREWYEAGRIIPLHHNVFSYFPFNVELHYLLAMHLRGGPWAGMYLAQFMHAAMMILTTLAACGFAATAPTPARSVQRTLLVLLAMSTTPWLAQLGAIAYDEGGFLLFGTLSIVWALLALRDPEGRVDRFALAGAMAGFACGCKLTAVPEVLVAIPLVALVPIAFSNKDHQPLLRRCKGPIVFGLVGLLVFSPWLVRTYRWSGNPVFPELPSILGHGHFSPVQVERWRRAHAAQPAQQSIPARLRSLCNETILNWQFGFLLIPLACVAVVLARKEPAVRFLGAMLFLLAVFWTGFTHLQGRFLILAVPVCALLIAHLPRLGLLICVQAVAGLAVLHPKFMGHMKPVVLGMEDYSWALTEGVADIPADQPLALVGEARAFFYQRPMSSLTYRTIFDADTSDGRGIIEAWAGPKGPGTQWLLIDPNELNRFAKTYQPFPEVPDDIRQRSQAYLQKR